MEKRAVLKTLQRNEGDEKIRGEERRPEHVMAEHVSPSPCTSEVHSVKLSRSNCMMSVESL